MLKILKRLIYTKPFAAFAFRLIRFYSLTFRLKVINEDWQDLLPDQPIIICTWHQQFFAAIRHFKSYAKLKPALMISQSKDGELIAAVANRTGWVTARGSSSRGGKSALNAMVAHINTHGFGAHILDGPTGPIGIVKPGIIRMARKTGALIIPFHVTADRAWYFNSWDRFMLPHPFSQVTITFMKPVRLDPIPSATEFKRQQKHLEQIMAPKLILP